jgi:hypothetical protein
VGPQEHQLQSKILLSEIMKLKKNDEQLVPFADFLRLVGADHISHLSIKLGMSAL